MFYNRQPGLRIHGQEASAGKALLRLHDCWCKQVPPHLLRAGEGISHPLRRGRRIVTSFTISLLGRRYAAPFCDAALNQRSFSFYA